MRVKHLLTIFALLILFSCKHKNEKVTNSDYDETAIAEEEISEIAIPNTKLYIESKLINATTFKVSNVDSIQDYFTTYNSKDVLETKIGKEILFFPEKHQSLPLMESNYNSFLESIHLAYSSHKPLIISPDMIWLTITQGVSIHINNNFEKYKSKLFIKDKPQDIRVRNDNLNNGPEAWEQLINSFSIESKKHVKTNFNNFFIPKFSTTTNIETTVFQTTMLETYEKGLMFTAESACGIPKITITGSVEDWKNIYSKIDTLDNFDLGYWKVELKPIIQEFINVKQGKVNTGFWQEIYKNSKFYAYSYYSGWIIKFFPYVLDKDFNNPVKNNNEEYNEYVHDKFVLNKYLKGNDYLFSSLESDNFPKGVSQIDIKWLNTGKANSMDFYAGFLGILQHKDGSLEPLITWTLCEKKANKVHYQFNDNNYPLKEHYSIKPIWINRVYSNTDVSAKYNNQEIKAIIKSLEDEFFIKFKLKEKISVEFIVSYNNKLCNISTNSEDKTKDEFIKSYFTNLKGKWTPGKKYGESLEEIYGKVSKDEASNLFEVNTKVQFTLFK